MSQSALWSGLALVNGLRARLIGAVPHSVSGVSIDTRTLNKGDLYVAIKGETNDGHDFVAKAFEKGAGAAVIDEAHADALKGLGSLYVVEDTLSALDSLGRAARARAGAHHRDHRFCWQNQHERSSAPRVRKRWANSCLGRIL